MLSSTELDVILCTIIILEQMLMEIQILTWGSNSYSFFCIIWIKAMAGWVLLCGVFMRGTAHYLSLYMHGLHISTLSYITCLLLASMGTMDGYPCIITDITALYTYYCDM